MSETIRACHSFIFFSIKFAGGTSDLMYKLCKAQPSVGIQPLISTGSHRFDSNLAQMLPDTKFFVTQSYFNKLGFSLMPGFIKQAQEIVKQSDIVHMHVFRTFQNVVLYYYCKKYNIPYVIDAHGAVPYHKNKRWLKKLFDLIIGRRMLREAAYLIAETPTGVKEYEALKSGTPLEKIVIISPPFDIDEFAKLPERGSFRKKYNISPNKKVIMFLGRIHYIKGIDYLIKGFAKLLQQRDDLILTIVGSDDGHQKALETLASSLNISDKVLFTGFLFAEDKLSALCDADIVAQTSRHEQGAWAPFEAVLCNTPIIVTSHTGAGEDVKKLDAGYLVNFDCPESFAKQAQYMFTHYSEAKEKTSAAAHTIRTELSMQSRIHEYRDLYRKAIEQTVG